METTLKEHDVGLGDLREDLDVLEGVVENLDKLQTNNNIKIRGLKEAIEGEDLVR